MTLPIETAHFCQSANEGCHLLLFKRLAGGISFESFARRAWRGQFAIYLVHFSIGHTDARQFCQLFHIENSLQLALYLLLVIGASFLLLFVLRHRATGNGNRPALGELRLSETRFVKDRTSGGIRARTGFESVANASPTRLDQD
jgi:hypothetical protein